MARITAWCRRFWLSPGSAANLGFCRVVCLAVLLLHPRPVGGEKLHRALSETWMPIWLFDVLDLPLVSVGALTAMEWVYTTALVTGMLGLLTRTSCGVACAVGLYLLGVPHNLGKINHDSGVIPFLLLILSAARSGDAWSLDALARRWRARRRGGSAGGPALVAPAEYHWPVRMVWLLTSWVFIAAAYSKLSASGLAWVFSDSMANTLLMHAYTGAEAAPVALWLSRRPWLCSVLAGASLLFEAAVPLAMFSARARAVVIPGLGLVLAGFLALGFTPVPFFAMLAFWVPWGRAGRLLARSGRGAWVLLSGRGRRGPAECVTPAAARPTLAPSSASDT
jgi:hypothetical protein